MEAPGQYVQLLFDTKVGYYHGNEIMRYYWERFTWGMVHGEGEGETYYPSAISPQSHQLLSMTIYNT